MREVTANQSLRTLAGHVRAMNMEAVLLKGAAMAGIAAERGHAASMRAAGDIDLWVSEGHAETLRRRLLESGWDGDPGAARTAPHHLVPVSWRGIPVEIHTRIMPSFWGLPEPEMLSETGPIETTDFTPFRRLDASAMVVHTAVHTASHLFPHGLKTAWDLATLQDWLRDEIDWRRVGALVQRTRLSGRRWPCWIGSWPSICRNTCWRKLPLIRGRTSSGRSRNPGSSMPSRGLSTSTRLPATACSGC